MFLSGKGISRLSSLLNNISILIVTWNGDDLLKDCLDSLAASCGMVPEVVVVDNADRQSTRRLVACYLNAMYVAAPGNPGFSGGNNVGVRLCTREYILLLNNDTVVHTAESVLALVRYLESHQDVAAVQGTMRLSRQGDILDECGSYINWFGGLFPRWPQAPVRSAVSEGPVFYSKGAFLMFRRKILGDLEDELFDNSFWSYFEDVDFCLRLWIIGKEVHYVNTPPIDHLCGVTAERFGSEKIFAKCLRNQLYSYLTLLRARTLLTLFPAYCLHLGLVILRQMVALDFGLLPVVSRVAADLWRTRSTIVARRKYQRRIRKVSDAAYWKKIAAKLPLRYYWLELRGFSPRYLWEKFGV